MPNRLFPGVPLANADRRPERPPSPLTGRNRSCIALQQKPQDSAAQIFLRSAKKMFRSFKGRVRISRIRISNRSSRSTTTRFEMSVGVIWPLPEQEPSFLVPGERDRPLVAERRGHIRQLHVRLEQKGARRISPVPPGKDLPQLTIRGQPACNQKDLPGP